MKAILEDKALLKREIRRLQKALNLIGENLILMNSKHKSHNEVYVEVVDIIKPALGSAILDYEMNFGKLNNNKS